MKPHGMMVAFLGLGLLSSGLIFAAFAGTEQSTSPAVGAGGCAAYSGLPPGQGETAGMVFIPGGTFAMGSERHQRDERPIHSVRVDGFWIDRHEVTNAQFRQFVDATGYRTLAERGLDPKAHPDMPGNLLV